MTPGSAEPEPYFTGWHIHGSAVDTCNATKKSLTTIPSVKSAIRGNPPMHPITSL